MALRAACSGIEIKITYTKVGWKMKFGWIWINWCEILGFGVGGYGERNIGP